MWRGALGRSGGGQGGKGVQMLAKVLLCSEEQNGRCLKGRSAAERPDSAETRR